MFSAIYKPFMQHYKQQSTLPHYTRLILGITITLNLSKYSISLLTIQNLPAYHRRGRPPPFVYTTNGIDSNHLANPSHKCWHIFHASPRSDDVRKKESASGRPVLAYNLRRCFSYHFHRSISPLAVCVRVYVRRCSCYSKVCALILFAVSFSTRRWRRFSS